MVDRRSDDQSLSQLSFATVIAPPKKGGTLAYNPFSLHKGLTGLPGQGHTITVTTPPPRRPKRDPDETVSLVDFRASLCLCVPAYKLSRESSILYRVAAGADGTHVPQKKPYSHKRSSPPAAGDIQSIGISTASPPRSAESVPLMDRQGPQSDA